MKLSAACRNLFWEFYEGKLSLDELERKIEALETPQGDFLLNPSGVIIHLPEGVR